MSGRDVTNSKVGRVIEEYDLDGFGDELERRWTGAEGDRESLRTLAEVFNRRVVRATLREAGQSPIDEDVDRVYDLLTGDDVSEVARTRLRRELARDGVDVDRLTSDFVSHQSIHTFLTEYRDAEAPRETDKGPENAVETIQRLRSRTAAVADTQIGQLQRRDHLTVGDPDVLVDVTVYCNDCERSFAFTDLVGRGHCDCFEP